MGVSLLALAKSIYYHIVRINSQCDAAPSQGILYQIINATMVQQRVTALQPIQ